MENETVPDATPEQSGTTGGSGTAGPESLDFCRETLEKQSRKRGQAGAENDVAGKNGQKAPEWKPLTYTGMTMTDSDFDKLHHAQGSVKNIFDTLPDRKDPRMACFTKKYQKLADSIRSSRAAKDLLHGGEDDIHGILKIHTGRMMPGQYMKYVKAAEELADIYPEIRQNVDAANKVIRDHLKNNGTLFRGASLDTLDAMLLHGGNVGSLGRKNYTKDGLDFVCCSVRDSKARKYGLGVVFKYDVSEMTDEDMRPVQYQVHNRAEHLTKRYIFGQRFGGNDGCDFLINGEVHLKNGARPKIRQVEFRYGEDFTNDCMDKIERLAMMQGAPIEVTWPKSALSILDIHPDLHSMIVDVPDESE